jgi:hypothetical protein
MVHAYGAAAFIRPSVGTVLAATACMDDVTTRAVHGTLPVSQAPSNDAPRRAHDQQGQARAGVDTSWPPPANTVETTSINHHRRKT